MNTKVLIFRNKMSLPNKVLIREVGLREGLQIYPKLVPLAKKLELVELLNQTGIKEIELTALVRSDLVPQMSDALELVNQYERKDGIRYTALALNDKGILSAINSRRLDNQVWYYLSASDTFFKKNYNTTIKDSLAGIVKRVQFLKEHNVALHGIMISCAFGCAYEGQITSSHVIKILTEYENQLKNLGVDFSEISLADTNGLANPLQVQRLVAELKNKWTNKQISLHLHDTRGLGMANAYAGLKEGVEIFESSVAGVGGCPFTKGASGNIATEELVYLLEESGVNTCIDLNLYVKIAYEIEALLGREYLSGKLYRALNK